MADEFWDKAEILIFEAVGNYFQQESSHPINIVTIQANVKLLKLRFPLSRKIVQPVTWIESKSLCCWHYHGDTQNFPVPCKQTHRVCFSRRLAVSQVVKSHYWKPWESWFTLCGCHCAVANPAVSWWASSRFVL